MPFISSLGSSGYTPLGRSCLFYIFFLTYPIYAIYKSELLSQMLGFYSALEIITSSAMVCDIWTDVRTGRWDDCIMGHYCDNRKALSSYIIIMAHVGFPSRRFPDMLGVFVWCFLKSLCLTGCLALVDHPCLKSYLFPPCRCQLQMRIVVPLELFPTPWVLALEPHHQPTLP